MKRRVMNHRTLLSSCLILFALWLCCGCGNEDEYHYPSVKLEFLTATTNSKGTINQITTDGGKAYNVQADGSNLKLPADTLLRIVTNYEEVEGGVRLYGAAVPVSNYPIPLAEFKEEMVKHPASIQSIWMGLDYLNMILQVKAQNKKHTFRFIEESATIDEETNELNLLIGLYHNNNGDLEAYTQRAYASVPLKQYAEKGYSKINIRFTLNTNEGETKEYNFEYLPL